MKPKRTLATVYLIALSFFLLFPLLITCIFSFATSWTKVLPNGWTLDYYNQVISQANFWPSVGRGLLISVIPVFISGLLIILTMYTSVLYYPWVDKVVQTICMLPHTLKGVILALAVLSMYVGSPTVLSDRILMLTMVYCVAILPYIYQGIRNNLNAINVHNLVEAAEILGSSKMYAFFRIIIPNMITGIMVSALLGMSTLFADFAIVKILAGSKYLTAQQLLYNSRSMPGQLVSVIVLILFLIVLLISAGALIIQNIGKKDADKAVVEE